MGPDVQLDDTFGAMVAQPDVGGSDAAVIHGLISHDLAGRAPGRRGRGRFPRVRR